LSRNLDFLVVLDWQFASYSIMLSILNRSPFQLQYMPIHYVHHGNKSHINVNVNRWVLRRIVEWQSLMILPALVSPPKSTSTLILKLPNLNCPPQKFLPLSLHIVALPVEFKHLHRVSYGFCSGRLK